MALLVIMTAALFVSARAEADLKAVFAFADRLVSVRFPELNYWILTTVDQNTRRIAVTFPEPAGHRETDPPQPHLEIVLEHVGPAVGQTDYHQHYLDEYAQSMGASPAGPDEPPPSGMGLTDCRMTLLQFTDAELNAHTALLITAVDGDVGIVALLDARAETFEKNKDVSSAIVRSIRFED